MVITLDRKTGKVLSKTGDSIPPEVIAQKLAPLFLKWWEKKQTEQTAVAGP